VKNNETKKSENELRPFALEFLETMSDDEQIATTGGKHHHKYYTMMASFPDPKHPGKVVGDF
jgi:hypothetical protein